MKAKLNLDTAKLKDFAIQHTEKVVFGIFGLTLLYFAYSGFLHETFDQSPTDLNTIITQARNHISKETERPPGDEDGTGVLNIDIEESLAAKELTAFATKELVRPNIRDLGSKRGNPVIMPPVDLHVAAGNGAIKLLEPPRAAAAAEGDGEVEEPVDTRGVSWAVITGVVPLDEQIDEYHEAFAAAIEKESGDEEPQYVFHQVQRQEIAPDGTVGPWQDVSTSGIKKLIDTWAKGTQGGKEDLISAEYIQRTVCSGLPPIIGYEFGEETAHPDLITPEEEPEEEEPAAVEPDPGDEGDLPDLPPDNNKKKTIAKKELENEPKQRKLLFRFFDLTATPGKTYRYRGRVWVTNPNSKVEERHLAEPNFVFEGKTYVTNKEKYLKSSWGSASPPVTIPFFGTLYAGEFVPGGSREDGMNMTLAVLEPKTGYELLDTLELNRGQFANFKEANPLVIKPSTSRETGVRIEDTELNSDHFVLDFVPQDGKGEFHAVVMGPDLKLRVVHESEELETRISDMDASATDEPFKADDDATNDPFGSIQLKTPRRRN